LPCALRPCEVSKCVGSLGTDRIVPVGDKVLEEFMARDVEEIGERARPDSGVAVLSIWSREEEEGVAAGGVSTSSSL